MSHKPPWSLFSIEFIYVVFETVTCMGKSQNTGLWTLPHLSYWHSRVIFLTSPTPWGNNYFLNHIKSSWDHWSYINTNTLKIWTCCDIDKSLKFKYYYERAASLCVSLVWQWQGRVQHQYVVFRLRATKLAFWPFWKLIISHKY